MGVQRLGTRGPVPRSVEERIADHVVVNERGCHVWQGATSTKGYPQMTTGSMADGTRRPRKVHRLVWGAAHGELPDGICLHHTCEDKRCVNLEHLAPVEHGEHSRLHHDLPITCRRGHPRTVANTYITKQGKRQCRVCKRLEKRPSRVLPPEMRHAHDVVDWALRKGTLVREPCEVCGSEDRVVAHHDNYSRPLDVRWLCPQHHADAHATMAA